MMSVADGVQVDLTVPTPGVVWDGDGTVTKDRTYQSALDSLSARWSGFRDVPSGVELYRWAIGTSVGGTELFNYRVVRGLPHHRHTSHHGGSSHHSGTSTDGNTYAQSVEVPLENGETNYEGLLSFCLPHSRLYGESP